MGDLQNLAAALHRAGPGDHADLAGAHLQVTGLDQRALLLDLGAGHFVGRQDRDHFLDSFPGFQSLLGAVALLAQGGDNG